MAERLTATNKLDNKRVIFNSEKNQITLSNTRFDGCVTKAYYWGKPIDKLAHLEDIMERLGINFVEDLEDEIKSLRVDKYIYKQDRNTWKRACELACKWFKQTGFIGDQTKVDYFYQQAKKEGNDE